MKIGLDSNVLVASVKKLGEPFHDSALELSKRIRDENGSGIGSALVLMEIPGALVSSTKTRVVARYTPFRSAGRSDLKNQLGQRCQLSVSASICHRLKRNRSESPSL
jgi:predicted nucleic acid-binding protein